VGNTRRTAIVTGGASGIGFATVKRLHSDGYAVAAVDRDGKGLDKVRALAPASDVRAYEADLRDTAATGVVVQDVIEQWARLHVLVNNAGIGVAASTIETSLEDWGAIIAVNLTATFTMCRHVLPRMIEAGGGVIVNVSSVAAVVGVRNRAAYCASKAGVVGLTRAIAVDHARQGIRANAICPGTVETEWIDKILADADDRDALRKQMAERQLDGQLGLPEEVAAGIAFLASDEARFVNGAAFLMDGGMSAI
jgi:NAD(P)-dependent dehydrogenase (short-subunit alcohol dehydrogenase family)